MRGRLHRRPILTPQRLPALLARRSSAPPGHVSEVGAFEPDESGGSSTSGSEPVTVGRLNRRVAEQKLDLFQFSTRQVAQPRATAPQIVGGWVLDTSALRSTFHNMPDRFRRDAIAPDFAHPVYSPENCPPTDFRRVNRMGKV